MSAKIYHFESKAEPVNDHRLWRWSLTGFQRGQRFWDEVNWTARCH